MKIGVIGLGYVGLPLGVLLSKKYEVIGYDKSERRVSELKSFNDKTLEVTSNDLESSNISFVSSIEGLKDVNFYIVTVPTPINEYKEPDLKPLESATKEISTVLKTGDIVVYESTVFPGCTEEFCVPLLEKGSGLTFNQDFYCGYSPERVNPGDKNHTIDKIIKVVSGSTDKVLDIVDEVYSSVITAGTHRASSIKTAESAKVIENAQRDINIAFVNELAIIFDKIGVDSKEVLAASATKWNFLNFTPGLVGGHCIGVDPYYLAFKSSSLGHHPEVILSGRKTNDSIPKFIADKVVKTFIEKQLDKEKSKVGILGLTFKENCPDTRNSKVFKIIESLKEYGIEPYVNDPYKKADDFSDDLRFKDLNEFPKCDILIVAVSHDEYFKGSKDCLEYLNENGTLFDIKSKFDSKKLDQEGIKYWRL